MKAISKEDNFITPIKEGPLDIMDRRGKKLMIMLLQNCI